MRIPGLRPAFSTLDGVAVLAILSVLATMAVPGLRRVRDGLAVRSARDAVAAQVERARALAAGRGSARLLVDAPAAAFRLEAPAGVPVRDPLFLREAFGVRVFVDGVTGPVVALDFNGLGLGVAANRTFRFRRGSEEARLSLSSFGRPRRW